MGVSSIGIESPVGAVIGFAGSLAGQEAAASLAAQGWLPCDGRALSAQMYPELFAVLGLCYGGAGDVFNLPAIPSQNVGAGEVSYVIKYRRTLERM